MSFLPFPKGQKVLHPQGKACTLGSEPVYCIKSIKCCGVKMHSQPVSVSSRTLCTGLGETTREEEGAPPRPHQPLQGHHHAQPADVPMCLPGAARCQGQDPQTFLGLRLCPLGQEGLGQSDSQGASGHQGLCTATWLVCAPSVLGAKDGRVPGHFLPSSHPRACVPGAQRACGAVSVALEGMSGHQALVLCPRL